MKKFCWIKLRAKVCDACTKKYWNHFEYMYNTANKLIEIFIKNTITRYFKIFSNHLPENEIQIVKFCHQNLTNP